MAIEAFLPLRTRSRPFLPMTVAAADAAELVHMVRCHFPSECSRFLGVPCFLVAAQTALVRHPIGFHMRSRQYLLAPVTNDAITRFGIFILFRPGKSVSGAETAPDIYSTQHEDDSNANAGFR